MSNFTDFIGGGGGSASFPTIFLSKSQTFVPPQDGNICIHVIGAGGSGGASSVSDYSSGAAGGYCKKNTLAVTTSSSFTVVVGAGGASVRGTSVGNAGGNTTVAGTGLSATLTANGGAGGRTGANSVGGSASNGDVNNTGGAGIFIGGGGAVGLTGTGNIGKNNTGLYSGADCDVVGDLWSSSLGQLAGDIGASGVERGVNSSEIPPQPYTAGPLAGGGYSRKDITGQFGLMKGGDATIGGGGGSCDNSSTGLEAHSGRGGEGIVVIQYIP